MADVIVTSLSLGKLAIRPTSWRVTAVPPTLVIRKFKLDWLVRETTLSRSALKQHPFQ